MEIISKLDQLPPALESLRARGGQLALVPTMGNLHGGHQSLIRHARQSCPLVAVSIFVNPSQFGPNEDLQLYPRTPQNDIELLQNEQVDLLFMPAVEQIYPNATAKLFIDIPELSQLHCGHSRPNHFKGVLLIVNMLFNLLRPDVAVFGKKDYQQLRLISIMAEYLHMGVRILPVDTSRDANGLALSSRNQYLTAEQLQLAPELYRQLQQCSQALVAGVEPAEAAERSITALQKFGFKPEYLQVVDPINMRALARSQQQMLVLAAANLGRARLIDNLEVSL